MKSTAWHISACCFLLLSLASCIKDAPVNKAPIAFAGNDTSIVQIASDEVIRLSLKGSGTDADGTVDGYAWRKIAGQSSASLTNANQATATASGLVAGTYQYELTVTDDQGAKGVDSVLITVSAPVGTELLLRPGPSESQMCVVVEKVITSSSPKYVSNTNMNSAMEISAFAWTFNAEGIERGFGRSYLKFTGLSALPKTKQVLSATLSLFGLKPNTAVISPQGNSSYPGSPYSSTPNPAWIRRVTGNWNATTITWNNKPAVTTEDQVPVPASTAQWTYDVLNLDVTKQVQYMVSKQQNFGFSLELQTELTYRNIAFASSKSTDPSIRPRLVVRYK